MSFTLYTRKDTGGLVVEAALAKSGAPHTCIQIDTERGEQNSADFVRINPMRQIPAIVLPDGAMMTESAAIVMHLAGLYPHKGLAPARGTPAHAKFLRWMLFMATNIYEADLRYFYAERYTSEADGTGGVKTAAVAHMAKCFAIIETALDPWVAGSDYSIADAYLAMLIGWSPEPVTGAKLKSVLAAVKADKDYGPVWKRHGPTA